MTNRLKTTVGELLRGEEPEGLESELGSAAKRAFRSRVALGIVLLSILSALAGWRASVFDEGASNSGAVFHQDVLLQQRLELDHEADVARDITQYGELEQHWFMANALRRDARAPAASSALSQLAAQETVATDQMLHSFVVAIPQTFADGSASYDPAGAYRRDVIGAVELEGLHPAAVRAKSDRFRTQAVNMTGVAALFVGALVLMTLAQVTLGRRRRGGVDSGEKERWSISHTLLVAGTAMTLLGVGLFMAVMLQ